MLGRKKVVMTIDEMNAYKTAYGNPLMKKEIFTSLFIPFMICAFSVYILFYYWWLALISGLIGSFYGYVVLMPNSVTRTYNQKSRTQRNRFINNMTQLLINDNETITTALRWCSQDLIAEGEFKKDLDKLLIELMDSNTAEIKSVFKHFQKKYKSDYVFSLFIDQLITASLEGRADVGKFKELKSWHNDVVDQTNIFMKNKLEAQKNFKLTSYYPVGIILILTFGLSFEEFILYYAHNPIGWVASTLLLGLYAYYYNQFQTKLVDDEVMEVEMWKKK